jgi:hypothetical protein
MHFNNMALKLASLVGLATLASAQVGSCSEASRFGDFQVSPTTLSPGDVSANRSSWTANSLLPQSITVTADFSCAVEKGNTPTFLDYYIEVLANNNGHEAPILLARRTFDNTTSPPADTFTTTVCIDLRKLPTRADEFAKFPSWFYFADAQYSVVLTNLFSRCRTLCFLFLLIGLTPNWNRAGPTGEQVITSGGVIQPITITGI